MKLDLVLIDDTISFTQGTYPRPIPVHAALEAADPLRNEAFDPQLIGAAQKVIGSLLSDGKAQQYLGANVSLR